MAAQDLVLNRFSILSLVKKCMYVVFSEVSCENIQRFNELILGEPTCLTSSICPVEPNPSTSVYNKVLSFDSACEIAYYDKAHQLLGQLGEFFTFQSFSSCRFTVI